MSFIRCPMPRLLGLAMLCSASACTTSGAIPPPADDLKAAVEAKPVPSDEIATSDQAAADYDTAIEGWGDRISSAGARICRWSERVYKIHIGCPATRAPQVIDGR